MRAQPGDFLTTAWEYLRGYYVPSASPEGGGELDPQLDFSREDFIFAPAIEQGLEGFYNEFTIHERRAGLEFLRGWQHVTRFGATMLSIATALTLIGLLVGTRRSRVGVLLFGIGGLALLVAPVLTGNYVGRYTVPMAGPLLAASAITLVSCGAAYGPPTPRRPAPGARIPTRARAVVVRAAVLDRVQLDVVAVKDADLATVCLDQRISPAGSRRAQTTMVVFGGHLIPSLQVGF